MNTFIDLLLQNKDNMDMIDELTQSIVGLTARDIQGVWTVCKEFVAKTFASMNDKTIQIALVIMNGISFEINQQAAIDSNANIEYIDFMPTIISFIKPNVCNY